MKKTIILFFVIVLNACSSGLYIIPKEYVGGKKYQIDDFNIYVFNICENYGIKDNEYHFCDCPENLYDVAEKNKIKKVEEVYLLIHKTTNLALYLTTFSHKYIYENQTGVLNDSCIYKNSIILDQIELFYVGSYDTDNDMVTDVYFENKKIGKPGVELHFKKSTTPDALAIDSVNIACAENHYSASKKIGMENVFSRELGFKKEPDYSMYFYKNLKEVGNVCKKEVISLSIIDSNKGIVLIFDYENCMDSVYKVTSKNIPYQPPFSKIE